MRQIVKPREKAHFNRKTGGMGFLTMCDIFKAAATAGIEELNDAADRKAAREKSPFQP